MKILLIEDNGVVATVLRRVLANLGYDDVMWADDGGRAVKYLEAHVYDLVIVDWMLPTLSGVTLVKWIRASDRHAHSQIIMATAKDTPSDVMEAVSAGVDDYMVKPIRPDVIEEKLASFEARFKKRKEAAERAAAAEAEEEKKRMAYSIRSLR